MVTVVIPAYNEASLIAETVRAVATLPQAARVVVVDDGSKDDTAQAAERAGADVVRHARNRGKAAALQTGAANTAGPEPLLFLDADLGATAANAGPLIAPVVDGAADMTIAVFGARVKLGGHGIVVRTAANGIRRATGWTPAQPLNGQRCLTRAAFAAAQPLAAGFGVETGMTIDLLRKGFRITEVEVEMAHRATGNDISGYLHRAGQLADVARALATRTVTHRNRYSALGEFSCAVCSRNARRGSGHLLRAGRLPAIGPGGQGMHGAGPGQCRFPWHRRSARFARCRSGQVRRAK